MIWENGVWWAKNTVSKLGGDEINAFFSISFFLQWDQFFLRAPMVLVKIWKWPFDRVTLGERKPWESV
jgi:hypothetical protein